MQNAARIAAITIILSTLTVPTAKVPMATITVETATAGQQALVDWALERYQAVELELPTLTISFHNHQDACHGFLGSYEAATRRLDMCNRGQHHAITPATTLLHELAHAWSFEHMTAEKQQDSVDHRNLADWSNDPSWWDRGQEQAAEIIAWGLSDGTRQTVYFDREPCEGLATAFELLTGTEPLHNSTEACAA